VNLPNKETGGRAGPQARGATAWWGHLSLATQFAAVAAVVIGITMTALGSWVALRIETSVVSQSALAAALYMDRFVEPFVQELSGQNALSQDAQDGLHELMTSARIARHLLAIKIWSRDGTVIYSSEAELIGRRFPTTTRLTQALGGVVGSELDELDAEENVTEKQMHRHILEIYAPIRESGTQRIIAVAEFYQSADELAHELSWTRQETALIVGCLSLLMLAALSGIVRRGSQTIAFQQAALGERIAELSSLLRQNSDLRQRVADANRRASESGERFLRRVSAELHDGAVQLIGLVILRLDSLFPPSRPGDDPVANEDLEIIRDALKDALNEIRDLAHGFALPELEGVSFTGALDIAISNHERRTGTTVEIGYAQPAPEEIPASIKTCSYRFVQEGLNNAFRHAGGVGQRVELLWHGSNLTIRVKDKGPGLTGNGSPGKGGLGLTGLRDRIESLGGMMAVASAAEKGTCLEAVFPLGDSDPLIKAEA
jgi:signal transduction histidine kinase